MTTEDQNFPLSTFDGLTYGEPELYAALDRLDEEFKPLVISFAHHLAAYRALKPVQEKAKEFNERLLTILGEAICLHFQYGVELLESVRRKSLSESSDAKYVDIATWFAKFPTRVGGHMVHVRNKEFLEKLSIVARELGIRWPAEEV
jgi:hypothetical protein